MHHRGPDASSWGQGETICIIGDLVGAAGGRARLSAA